MTTRCPLPSRARRFRRQAGRFAVLIPLGLFLYALVAGAAYADTTWTRISPNFDANSVVPSLASDGPNAVAAWGYRVGANNERVEAVTFQPSLSRDAVSLAGPVAVAAGWVAVGVTPQLFPRPGGGLQIAFEGFRTIDASDPFAGATAVASRNPDGSYAAPVRAGRPYLGLSSAILLPDGTPMLATGFTGARVLRGIDPDQLGFDYQAQLGGCCGYSPRLGLDGMGRLWIVWHSNATNNAGDYVQQVSPATATPIGSAQKVPASESANNNTFRIAFACAVVCRVVYGTGQITNQRLVSWAPGEGAATTIARIPSTDSAGRVVTASYRSDGRLWVAWYDGENYRFTLGDAKGGGGAVLDAGHPAGADGAQGFGLNSLPVEQGLLLATNWLGGVGQNRHAIWANVVTEQQPPQVARTANVAPVSGVVTVRPRGTARFVRLTALRQIPVGSELDTTRGRVRLTAAAGGGKTQIGDFFEGRFILSQTAGRRPVATMRLSGPLACPKGRLLSGVEQRRKRRLWGSAKGRFRTKGRFASAAVRGTVWLTEDSCDGTLVRVRAGRIEVFDAVKGRRILLRAGQSYFARARR